MECQQEPPPDCGVAVVDEGKTEVQPVCDGDTEVVGDEDVAQEATSVTGRRRFGDEDGCDTCQSAGTDAGDDSCDDDEVA